MPPGTVKPSSTQTYAPWHLKNPLSSSKTPLSTQKVPLGHSHCAMASTSSCSPRSCGRSRGGPRRQRSRAARIPRRPGARTFPCRRNTPNPSGNAARGGGRRLVPPTPTAYTPTTEREPEPGRTRLSESSALWKCCSASVKEIGGGGAAEVPPDPAGRQGVGQNPRDPGLPPE